MARYHLNNPHDYLAALDFINRAKEQKFDIELKKYYPKRSNKQNGFLYFLLQYFAHQYGVSTVESKEIYLKRYACPHIFEQEAKVGDQTVTYYRSTSDLNTAEMASAIRGFIDYANMHGIMLPEPTDDLAIRCAEREMESSNGWK